MESIRFSKMIRTKNTQSKHNREVSNQARKYDSMGFKVHADIKNWPKPATIYGYRPDVTAIKPNKSIIVEVETVDSVNIRRDLSQQRAFRRWASKSVNRLFKRIVV